jgi:Mg2+-importing ATPase
MNKSTVKPKAKPDDPAWWLKPLAEPQAELATDAAGLSNAEAGSRLAKFGPNLFRDHQERPLFLQFLARFNLKKSVELNPAKNIQHKLDRPTAGMSFI